MKQFVPILLLASIVLFLGGCGADDPYGAVVVKGTVTVDGKPMDGITISFNPVSGDGMNAGGMTDKQGRFVLTTGGAPFGTGAVPGEYNVTFAKVSNSGSEQPQQTVDEFNAQIAGGGRRPSGPMSRVVHHIPEKYSKTATSDIQPVIVEKKGKNSFNFDLKTKD